MGQARVVRIRYTIRAARELDEVLAAIDRLSPQGASSVKRRLSSLIDLLLQHPEAGRLSGRRLRRVIAYPYPYFVFYRATPTEIVIHGIRHSSRNPSTMPK